MSKLSVPAPTLACLQAPTQPGPATHPARQCLLPALRWQPARGTVSWRACPRPPLQRLRQQAAAAGCPLAQSPASQPEPWHVQVCGHAAAASLLAVLLGHWGLSSTHARALPLQLFVQHARHLRLLLLHQPGPSSALQQWQPAWRRAC